MSGGDLRRRWDSGEPFVFANPTQDCDPPSPDQGEVAFATSGSTGTPRFIVHTRDSLTSSARMVNAHLGAGPGERWLRALPEFHVGGFGVHVRAWELGGETVVLEGRWDAAGFAKAIAQEQITWSSLVPAQVADLVALGETAPTTLRGIVVGGGSLDKSLADRARDLGWPVVQSYGMTEAGSQVATGLPEEPFSHELPILGGWETRIASSLQLRGPALGTALLKPAPDGVWERLPLAGPDGWFETEDRVELTSEGRLRWLGRADSVVKILGELVSLDALQADLDALLDRPGAAVVLDLSSGRDRELVVVAERGCAANSLLERFNADRPGLQRASRILEVERLPRTTLGKVPRERLRRLLS